MLLHHTYDLLVRLFVMQMQLNRHLLPSSVAKSVLFGVHPGDGQIYQKNVTSLLILCPSCIKIRDNLLDIWTVPKSTLFGIFYGDSDFVVERSFYDILSHCFCRFFDF